MEKLKRWRYFRIDTPDTFQHFDECSKLVKKLHEGFLPMDSWWTYYGDHIRFAVHSYYEDVLTIIHNIMQDGDPERIIPYVVKEIKNPDLDERPLDVCNQIDEIKNLVAKVVHEMGYKEPESLLEPTYTFYFIHLFMNALGYTYFSEAQVYTRLSSMVLNGMLKKDG